MVAKKLLLNRKIYILFLGSVLAMLFRKYTDIDFSFYKIDYRWQAFGNLFLFYFIHDFKRFAIVLLIRKWKYYRFLLYILFGWIGFYGTLILLITIQSQDVLVINRMVYAIALWMAACISFRDELKKRTVMLYSLIFLLGVYVQVLIKIFL